MPKKKNGGENLKLKIAGVVIRIESKFPLKQHEGKEANDLALRRFKSFVYAGNDPADIRIEVEVCQRLPDAPRGKPLFVSYHPEDDSENWRLIRQAGGLVYQCAVSEKKQVYYLGSEFDRAKGYLLAKPGRGMVWEIEDVIYDFLQVLLINYLAKNKRGFFVHSVGIKDRDGKGLLFAGESGAGKSTMARIWDRDSRASILNDDRVIVRKTKGNFYLCGTPWHGDFNDYLGSRIEEADASRVFFIYHSPKNTARKVLPLEAFRYLYPQLFPTFWDRRLLNDIISLGMEFIRMVPAYRMGFVKSKEVINLIRQL